MSASGRSVWRRIDRVLRPGGRVFYGWWIAAAGSGVQWLAAMLWMHSYGAYVVLLHEDFGWSKTLLGLAFALTRVESGLLGPVQGWLADRFGPRVVLSAGTLMFGAGFMLFSGIQSLLGFYLCFALMAFGSSLGGFATLMVAIVHWFDRHRAKAVAVSQFGFSLGGMSVPLIVLCLNAFGWRATAFCSGLLIILLGLPLVRLVRHRPGDCGDRVDGIPAEDWSDEGERLMARGRDYTAAEAMRTWSFWLISFGHSLALLAVSSVLVHLVPHLTEGLGYSLAQASLAFALMTGCQLLGQVVGGYLGDRFEKRYLCMLCMAAHAVGLLALAFADDVWMVLSFAVLHGLAWGLRAPQMVALRADYFGPSSFGAILGFSGLVVMLGMSGGPIIAGYMADVSGDYRSGFVLLALLALLGSACFFAARPPKTL